MVIGVGTDILLIDRIRLFSSDLNDVFMRKTYTKSEIEQASSRDDPCLYFATRFAGKEAVFKAMDLNGIKIDFSNIEILNDCMGKPWVTLNEDLKQLAYAKGIVQIIISLSYDTDYATAFVIAQS